jgi:rubrerythrin
MTNLTSAAWWAATRSHPEHLHAWLYDQYRGEVTAAGRIEALRDAFTEPSSRAHRVLTVIAAQERTHAGWVGELLAARGLPVEVTDKPDRYWREVVPEISDLATGAAVGAHAERMRLERIEVIADDPEAPADIRAVFARILPQERFHARAFAELSTAEALDRTKGAHALGRRALGLV